MSSLPGPDPYDLIHVSCGGPGWGQREGHRSDPAVDSERRLLHQIGPGAREELLAALIAPEEERAARIGRLYARGDAQLLAELLTELEVNEPARLRFIPMIREIRAS